MDGVERKGAGMKSVSVSVGDQVYAAEGDAAFGAVRRVSAHELIVNVENHGDVTLSAESVLSVHDGKVIVEIRAVPPEVLRAIGRAHTAEDR